MSSQLTLPIELGEANTFDNYVMGENATLVNYLKGVLSKRSEDKNSSYIGIVIWGEASGGKTHLLAALSDHYAHNSSAKLYLIDDQSIHHSKIQKGDSQTLYILESIDSRIAQMDEQAKLLSLIEQVKQQNSLLLITSEKAMKRLNIPLADLSSRLRSLESFELIALADEHKRVVLKNKANQRGFTLSDDVLSWILTHASRDLGVLVTLLDKIDEASLAQHRKVTIPLIKSLMGDQL